MNGDDKLIATHIPEELHKEWAHLCIEMGVTSKSLLQQVIKDRLRLEENKMRRAAEAEKTGKVPGPGGRREGK